MFDDFKIDSKWSIPFVFYPTTVFLIDDDKSFLQMTSLQLREKFSIQCFSDAKLAIETIKAEKDNFNNGDYLKEHFNANSDLKIKHQYQLMLICNHFVPHDKNRGS